MAIKMIFFDLDGTLLTEDKQVAPAVCEALERAAAKGIYLVPSTGRFYNGLPEAVRAFPFLRYVVLINGACILDVGSGEILRRAEIEPETALRLAKILAECDVVHDAYIDGAGYMNRCFEERIPEVVSNPVLQALILKTRYLVEDLGRYLETLNRPVQKMQAFFADGASRQSVWRRVESEFPELLVTSSIEINMEINVCDASKGAALQFLAGHLGIDIAETMAIGDGSNDISMLRAAGVGVAMGNAAEDVKAAADYVTDTNARDGVARAIEKFCLADAL